MIAASTRAISERPGVAEAPKPSGSPSDKILSRFHTLMLQQAFKTMMQSDTVNNGKSTLARDVWRDQLAEKLALAATQSGGLGGSGKV
jgi:hypothetical protein